jgi:hypothetical protein
MVLRILAMCIVSSLNEENETMRTLGEECDSFMTS